MRQLRYIGAIIFTCWAVASTHVPQASPNSADYTACAGLEYNTFPAALIQQLGAWKACQQIEFKQTETRSFETVRATWPKVQMNVKFSSPENAVYTVTAAPDSPLTSEWFDAHKTHLISEFFHMDWNKDHFPGPRAHYYTSKKASKDAQFWIETDGQGKILWMQFSYGL